METAMVVTDKTPRFIDTRLVQRDVEEARAFRITNFEEKKIAVVRRDLARLVINDIEKAAKPHIERAHATWKGLTEEKAEALKIPKLIVEYYGQSITNRELEDAQERVRKAHEERERLRKQEEDRRLEEATALEREGRTEEAQIVISEPLNTPPVVIVNEEKIEGQYLKDNWSGEIYDLLGFIIGIAEGKVPLAGALGIEDMENGNRLYTSKYVNQQARSLKSMLALPGVRVVNRPTTVKRGFGL